MWLRNCRERCPRAADRLQASMDERIVGSGSIALEPSVATSHQSMLERSNALVDVYANINRCLPSLCQIGKRAVAKLEPTRCGCPPPTGTTQTAPFPGTVAATL